MQQELRHPTADVILRSSDKQLFYSWKNFLSISSPVFAVMFTLPQAADADEQHDGLPVIDLAEDSHTLDNILSLCLPPSLTGKRFKVDGVRQLRALIDVTIKYEMENVRRAVLEELSNPLIIGEDPMYAFALACQYELREAAQLAAKHTLNLSSLVATYVPELEKFHAGKLWHLFSYREKCITAASSLAADHTWIVITDASRLFGCNGEEGQALEQTRVRYPPSNKYRNGRLELVSVHRWWIDYMRKSESALRRRPNGDEVRAATLVDEVLSAISTSTCKECQALHASEAFRAFVNTFAETINRRVAEIEINPGF